jgi:hypothetical protein
MQENNTKVAEVAILHSPRVPREDPEEWRDEFQRLLNI